MDETERPLTITPAAVPMPRTQPTRSQMAVLEFVRTSPGLSTTVIARQLGMSETGKCLRRMEGHSWVLATRGREERMMGVAGRRRTSFHTVELWELTASGQAVLGQPRHFSEAISAILHVTRSVVDAGNAGPAMRKIHNIALAAWAG